MASFLKVKRTLIVNNSLHLDTMCVVPMSRSIRQTGAMCAACLHMRNHLRQKIGRVSHPTSLKLRRDKWFGLSSWLGGGGQRCQNVYLAGGLFGGEVGDWGFLVCISTDKASGYGAWR